MQEKSLIKKNILEFLDNRGITRYEFYKETGITRGILDQNNGMSEFNIAKFIAQYPEVSIEWLITGNGSMYKEDFTPNKVQPEQRDLLFNMLKEKDKRIEELNQEIGRLKQKLNKGYDMAAES